MSVLSQMEFRERQPLAELMRDCQMPTIDEDKIQQRRTLELPKSRLYGSATGAAMEVPIWDHLLSRDSSVRNLSSSTLAMSKRPRKRSHQQNLNRNWRRSHKMKTCLQACLSILRRDESARTASPSSNCEDILFFHRHHLRLPSQKSQLPPFAQAQNENWPIAIWTSQAMHQARRTSLSVARLPSSPRRLLWRCQSSQRRSPRPSRFKHQRLHQHAES
jgi:hypothetical protein